jgi:hypothetical protein
MVRHAAHAGNRHIQPRYQHKPSLAINHSRPSRGPRLASGGIQANQFTPRRRRDTRTRPPGEARPVPFNRKMPRNGSRLRQPPQHPAGYSRDLAALDPAARKAVERSLAGLRFIRSQLSTCADPADFIQPPPGHGARPATAWTWSAVPPPHPQRGKARDVSPYREYRTQLAGRPVAEALTQASGFLAQVHATASRPGRHPASGHTGQA